MSVMPPNSGAPRVLASTVPEDDLHSPVVVQSMVEAGVLHKTHLGLSRGMRAVRDALPDDSSIIFDYRNVSTSLLLNHKRSGEVAKDILLAIVKEMQKQPAAANSMAADIRKGVPFDNGNWATSEHAAEFVKAGRVAMWKSMTHATEAIVLPEDGHDYYARVTRHLTMNVPRGTLLMQELMRTLVTFLFPPEAPAETPPDPPVRTKKQKTKQSPTVSNSKIAAEETSA